MQKLRLFITASALFSLSACATVDLTSTPAMSDKAQSVSDERNIVQRAASKLYAAFASKGLSAKNSKTRVQSAASVLLKGLKPATAVSGGSYVDKNTSKAVVLTDMREAVKYVSQTTKAAEVYLAMAPANSGLVEELSSLERALLMSRQAETVFAEILDDSHKTDVIVFGQAVDALRDVTDAYGDRVRENQTFTAPAAS